MIEFEPGCKLDIGYHIHVSFEKGLVSKRIFKVSEGDNMIAWNIIIIPFGHRVKTGITIPNECQHMKQILIADFIERCTVPRVQGIVSPNDPRNPSACWDTRE
jgi:hypothetical protein